MTGGFAAGAYGGEFHVEWGKRDYQYYLDEFSGDKKLGSVENADMAKKEAGILWEEIYGEISERNHIPLHFYMLSTQSIGMICLTVSGGNCIMEL